jgi:hypothetical protein
VNGEAAGAAAANGSAAAPAVPAAAERTLRPVPADESASSSAAGPEEEAADGASEPAEHGGRGTEQPASGGAGPASRPFPEQALRRPQPGPTPAPPPASQAAAAQQQPRRKNPRANRRPSGRERHDEKITVYVSAEELMDLEHARLVLRGEHGLAVDRGRIVREAVAVVLADLESRGDASILVRRLRGR